MNKPLEPAAGRLLVSEPFLEDPNFHRTVIQLVEHNENGSLGFVLNHVTVLNVRDLFEDFDCSQPVYLGGPVGRNTFHYLHTLDSLEGATEILPGLYWGGDFEMLKFMYQEGLMPADQIRFFAGYSGWGEAQLVAEMDAQSWIVAPGEVHYVFDNDKELWKHVLSGLGGEFRWLSNAPEDVRLN